MSQHLCNYYEKLQNEFYQHTRNTLFRREEEDIHQLRVTVKKLRALLHLIAYSSEGIYHSSSHLTIFKPLFKAAGTIRDLQIHLKLLEKEDTPSFLTQKLQQEIEIQQTLLTQQLIHFDFQRLLQLDQHLVKVIKHQSTSKILSDLKSYVQREQQQVEELLKEDHPYQHLHEVRKHLKKVATILDLGLHIRSSKKLEEQLQAVKTTNTLLGEWHDWDVLAEKLQTFKHTSKTSALIKKIQKKADKKGRHLLKEIQSNK
ncbi:CHAD domain-containing protein [Algivirga pacifica]|uniref:CHAD domain-containing protein n=1 Tax=Algivirga pacifica TaxID=1162670 RepID=A0ABP9DJ14_9BACT